MPVVTIADLTADEKTALEFRKGLRGSNSLDLLDDTKYALVVLQLHPSVTQADHPAIGTGIKAVTGVVDVDLLLDHETRASIPADHKQTVQVTADIQLAPVTPA